ncbi:putative aminopeptidase-2 isoform X1 [Bombus affinis]|uniref:putative aminopeptidase-2 isoform X1 n=1 Tax=Bombus affinis TaxID=309941 RepID=UPI0021B7FD64|nr:putative aminopeptidase-2 isoform X1 [Bombus affinis]XP_050580181.1 putative aminopeptidase-2 isoform X1 [Bombus affinis]
MNLFRDQFLIVVFLLLHARYQATNNVNKAAYAQDDTKEPTNLDYRLPKTIIPTNYEIILIPKLKDNFEFKGIVHISAYLQKSTDTITLHHGQMKINLVTVTIDVEKVEITNTMYNSETEKYEIKLSKVLSAGTNITINFDYVSALRDDMIGFYKSSYVDSNGKIRWLASTQFQTTHARHAFPCFDEPSFKATYIIRILRPAEYSCLSNMPLNRSIDVNETVWDEFKQSIPMSTYLVAFIISDFSPVKADNFKVWAKPNAIDQAKYALNIGMQGLDYLSKRFKQNYQISKMDMVAVPDFSAGAMENWGLITYRESRLLYDENSTSDIAKQSIASVIIHELTHMWFGNMITPEWWSYLWLSEAFARYFQYFGTAQIEKSWNMEDQFLVEQHQTALAVDAIESSQPMTRNVTNSSQIRGVGDTITYNKGASILRMMNLVFGSDVFDATLQNYLNNNAEKKVARPQNLWSELQTEINRKNIQLGTSVEEIMSTWTEQAGFPVVKIFVENGQATLQQERFLLRNMKSTPINVKWWIPITWTTQENMNFNQVNVTYWLKPERETTIKLNKSSGWVIFNVQSAGFYRVNYDNASWYRIIDVLNSKNYQNIHVLNRAALVDDLLNLARAGLLNYRTTLDGLQYIRRERNYLPFKAAFSGITYLDQRLSGDNEYYKHFKEFVLVLIKDVYKDIGYVDRSNDDRLTVLLRGELNKWACNYGHKTCVQTFTRMFQQWTKYNITIKPNQRPVAYCMGVKYGTKEDWEFLWNKYSHSNSATEQVVILEALGCTEDAVLLEKYLLYALKNFEESRIRMQDNSAVFSAVHSSSAFGAGFVLDFVAKHSTEMIKFYKGTETISSILSSASKRFSTQKLVDKFENLIKQHQVEFKNILDSLNNSLELAKYELSWLKKYTRPIMSWVIDFNDKHRQDTDNYRLPTSITPNSYSIWITTDLSELDNFTFKGSVKIKATVTNKTKNITLHSADLIHEYTSVVVDSQNVVIVSTDVYKKYDFLVIELEKELQVGQKLVTTIEYRGHLNEKDMRGFYRSSYIDEDGQTRWLAATHMEPVGARKMFPCFDEPAMKANFTMSVLLPQKYTAISNMPVEYTYQNKNATKTIVFKETPKMSTYLVALIISDFVSVKDAGKIHGVWARRNAIEDGKYALSVMTPLVNFYESVVNISYQLPKLDMVALPDFVSGAMENWGLLTYKERNILYDHDLSTTASKQSIVNVISHEISHQWFGNLVSPKWWKYIWLNEGFARYFEYFGTEHIKLNKWSLEAQFVVEQLHSAFETDSSISTHAMTHDVWSPTQIRGIFDSISYAKAGSVLRMIEKVLGRRSFYEALANYLKKRQYDVATPEDLIDAISEEVKDQKIKILIPDIMNSWTTQPGYPVVHANIDNNHLTLTQQRFFLNPEESSTNSIWYIPISWTNLNDSDFQDTKPKYWFKSVQESIILPSSDFYLLNVQQSGYYQVNYAPDNWKEIIKFLKSDRFNVIHEINRAALIDDLLNLGRAGYVDYPTVLSATQYLSKETNYIPWRAFLNGLTYLHKQFEGKEGYKAFVRYLSSLLTPVYNKLGFEDKENDDHVTLLFRSHIRKWACQVNIANCKSRALSYFNSWANNEITMASFPPNIRSVSYCTVAEQNDPESWNRLWALYSDTTFAAQKLIILQSLACATKDDFLDQLLHTVLSDKQVRFEDSSSIFSSVINSGPKGIEFVINFIEKNYEKMVSYFQEISTVNSIVNAIGKKVFTNKIYAKYVELLNFLDKKQPMENFKAFSDYAKYELKWGQENIPGIFQWIEEQYPSMNYRLPKSFSPLRYNITLSPYFAENNFIFTGRVQIEMECNEDYISHIVLHSSKLEITGLSLQPKHSTSNNENSVSGLRQNNDTETLTIFMKRFIQAKELVLDISFTGKLNDDMEGFYRSYYITDEGNIRWLAATQFEATYARQAFPCFDEPAFKAKFVINMERPKDYKVLSNMPRNSLIPLTTSDRVVETFNETVSMSTYLVAFVVSDFDPMVNAYLNVNIWGRPNIAQKGYLAQIAARRILDYLQMETNHEYTLPKLDLVGIPDFSMGAMENWGLATFREYGLFYDKIVTSAKYRVYIITIIAHEIAHMMYGNLVTCDWWEHLWLNEGFAEYMQWRLAEMFEPDFGYNDLFVVDELQPAMEEDALLSTHPMNNAVNTPNEIEKIFDAITYGKSASVIRMIQKSLKPETFKEAMYLYLDRHKYRTATPNDLWKAFDDAMMKTSDLHRWLNMSNFMSGWTNSRGYPVVSAKSEEHAIILSQKNFFTPEVFEEFWIPITMTTASKLNFSVTTTDTWLQGSPITIPYNSQEEWFILNIQQSGYYRVNYDTISWNRLINALKSTDHTLIHVTNRAQIIDDLLNLARADWITYGLALNGTTYLLKEQDYIPWKAFFTGMNFLLQRYQGNDGENLLKKYIRLLAANRFEKLDFEDNNDEEFHMDQLNKDLILSWMCKLNHTECVDKSIHLFAKWRWNDTYTISPNARTAVYCTAIRNGSLEEWEFLWDQYLKTDFASEKKIILEALGCSMNKEVLNSYIERALTYNYTSNIRKQDVSTVLASVYNSGKFGVDVMLDYLVNNYENIYNFYEDWDGVEELISKLASRISVEDQITKLNELSNKVGNITNIVASIKTANTSASSNLQWYRNHSSVINDWLHEMIHIMQDKNPATTVVANNLSIISMTVFSLIAYIMSL